MESGNWAYQVIMIIIILEIQKSFIGNHLLVSGTARFGLENTRFMCSV